VHHRTLAILIGAVLCVVPLAGCTTTNQGQPRPEVTGTPATTTTKTSQASSEPPAPSSGQLPSDGAPKVKSPLDTRRFQQNPCQVLTPTQLQRLNLPAQGQPGQAPLGPKCDWTNRETRGNVQVHWTDKNPRGLSGDYAARKAGKFAYFVELPEIEGFPAVAAHVADTRDLGDCNVSVGVTDQLTFLTFVQLSQARVGTRDPCDAAREVAGMALRTMKAGG
jgi:hypothetical protein